jgi:hypothetical protein
MAASRFSWSWVKFVVVVGDVWTCHRIHRGFTALMALSACMPRVDLELAGKSYRLEFPATP